MKMVVFLRGINVGGNSKVPMSDLKKMLEALGFQNVKTLLNGGNVIFNVSNVSKGEMQKKIEEVLEKKFGFRIAVILRTIEEIKKIVDLEPFKKFKTDSNSRLYVTFLPEKELFNVVDLSQKGTTDLMKEIEREYPKMGTTRNWNTVLKIALMEN